MLNDIIKRGFVFSPVDKDGGGKAVTEDDFGFVDDTDESDLGDENDDTDEFLDGDEEADEQDADPDEDGGEDEDADPDEEPKDQAPDEKPTKETRKATEPVKIAEPPVFDKKEDEDYLNAISQAHENFDHRRAAALQMQYNQRLLERGQEQTNYASQVRGQIIEEIAGNDADAVKFVQQQLNGLNGEQLHGVYKTGRAREFLRLSVKGLQAERREKQKGKAPATAPTSEGSRTKTQGGGVSQSIQRQINDYAKDMGITKTRATEIFKKAGKI